MTDEQVSPMETETGHSWFLMIFSWEPEDDNVAMGKWAEVYNYFRPAEPRGNSARSDISNKGLVALNLIGERQFVIAGQTKSNKPLQEISAMVTLYTSINVEVFAATNVLDFKDININLDFLAVEKSGSLSATDPPA